MSAIRETKGEKVFNFVNYIIITILSLIFLIPFLLVLGTSFLSEKEIIQRGMVIIPHNFDFTAYKLFLRQGSILFNAYKITIFRIVVGTTLNLLITSMYAYALSKKDLPGRNFFVTIVFITMIIGGGLIPTYMVIKSLKLVNSVWSMIIPGLMSVWNMLILRNFFYTIPQSLEESALLDGATPFQILIKIIIPLSMPAFATIGLFYAVGHWNAWFDGVIYINDSKKYPVQVVLRQFVLNLSSYELENYESAGIAAKPPIMSIKSAVIIISTLPIICIYPFIQKYFVKGIMIGSIKG